MRSVLLVMTVLQASVCLSSDTDINPISYLPEFYDLGGERFFIEEELALSPVMACLINGQWSVRCRGCYFRSNIGPHAKMVICGCCLRSFCVAMPREDEPKKEQLPKEEKLPPHVCKVIRHDPQIQRPLAAATIEAGRGIKRPHEHEPKTACSRPRKSPKIHECAKKNRSFVFHAIAHCAAPLQGSHQLDLLNGTITFSGIESYRLFLDCIIMASGSQFADLNTEREKRHKSLRRYADFLVNGKLTKSYEKLLQDQRIELQINNVYLYKFQLQREKCENNEKG